MAKTENVRDNDGMITPSHVVYNVTLLGRRHSPQIVWAIILGSIFPDIFNFIFFIWNRFVMHHPVNYIWDHLYFESWWNNVFNLSHSFWLLPFLLGLSYFWKRRWATFFWGSALLHAGMDFFVHHDDAYAHFYPWSDWRFRSPISYWDPKYFGVVVSSLEMVVSLYCVWVLFRRTKRPLYRAGLLVLGVFFVYSFVFMLGMHIACPSVLTGIMCGFS